MPTREPVIGLECHARLLTLSKMFCGCSTTYGSEPNSQTCATCLAYPGALPSLNRKAVELAIRVALATGCTIHERSSFARKNYFYADLPKGYQISQHEQPLATGGSIEIRAGNSRRKIRIQRIHLEEDAGKSLHDEADDVSLIDLNRAGTPLIEIVSEPDLASAEEAILYMTRLRQILMYTEACDGNMDEGSLRVDVNVSVSFPGEPLGTRAEVKNVNSFRFLGRAIEFETLRQNALLHDGERVVQETRLFDPASGETRGMRSKEEAHDYRYFPEPDLLPLILEEGMVERIRADLPALPHERVGRYETEWLVTPKDAEALVATKELADYFEAVVARSGNARLATNWVKNEVLRALNEDQLEIEAFPILPDRLAALIQMIERGDVGGKTGKEIFEEMRTNPATPDAIVREKGLTQISDPETIRTEAVRVVAENPAQLEQYRLGKTQLFGYFVGQLMKATGGKANAELANKAIREILDRASDPQK